MSKICLDINNLQIMGVGDVLQIYVFMIDIHIIGLKIGLKRHKFLSGLERKNGIYYKKDSSMELHTTSYYWVLALRDDMSLD